MRKEYDFSKAKKNPYVTKVKKQITIRLDEDAIEYFKTISDEIGIPYQASSTCICATVRQKTESSISIGSEFNWGQSNINSQLIEKSLG